MKKEEIRQAVETSMNKVFGGNMRPNEGKIENHSSDSLKNIILGLLTMMKRRKDFNKQRLNLLKSWI